MSEQRPLVTVPKSFRVDKDDQQATWSVKLNEFVKDTIKGLEQTGRALALFDVPFTGGQIDVSFETGFVVPILGTTVVHVENLDNPGALLPGAVYAQTVYVRGNVIIRQVFGLSGDRYNLRFLVVGV